MLVETRGQPVVLIPLSKGGQHGDGRMKYALMDASDYELVKGHRWSAFSRNGLDFYAQANVPGIRGRTVQLSRVLLGLDKDPTLQADHENHHTLDNRRRNIRIATLSQNRQNARRRRDNTSGYRGVRLHVNKEKNNWTRWHASINADGQYHFLGYFTTPEAAALAYDAAATRLHGEFALRNSA